MKSVLLVFGLIWSGGLITASALKYIDLSADRDFFVGVFGGCSAGLHLVKKKPEGPV